MTTNLYRLHSKLNVLLFWGDGLQQLVYSLRVALRLQPEAARLKEVSKAIVVVCGDDVMSSTSRHGKHACIPAMRL